MRWLVILGAVFSVSSIAKAQPADWDLVMTRTDGAEIYVRRALVKVEGPRRTAWVITRKIAKPSQGEWESRSRTTFDCSDEAWQLETMVKYTADGRLLSQIEKPADKDIWLTVVPATEGETIMRHVCSMATTR